MLTPVTFHAAEQYAICTDELSKETLTFFAQSWGCARKLYNLYVDWFYQELEAAHYTSGDDVPKVKIPEASFFKNKEEFNYLKHTDSLALANVKLHFTEAVKRFREQKDHKTYTKRAKRRADSGTEPLSFRGLKGIPKFHAKAKGYFSYTTNNQRPSESGKLKQDTIRLNGNLLHLPKVKQEIPLVIHRPLPESAVIGNVTISKSGDGNLYASIAYSYTVEMDLSLHQAVMAGDADILESLSFLGLDYSQEDFFVDSEGRKANYPHYYRKSEEKLARLQAKLSKMEYNSKNYQKIRQKIQKLHAKIANQRKDFLQKLSTAIVKAYDVVVVEDMDLREMSAKLNLGKNLHDNGFGMFRDMLAYKLERKSSFLVKAPKYFPSSQLCSKCGHQNPEVKNLDLRFWQCPVCGHAFQRDYNAAVNLREKGKQIFLSYAAEQLTKQQAASAA